MINQGFYSATPTKLDLNGPYMSFTSIPSGITGNPGDTINLVGVATASFIGAGATTVNDGIVLYRWYEVIGGNKVPLSDGNRLSGTSTNILTISNLQSPGDSNRQFYLEAKYQSTAYKNRSDGKNGNHISPAESNPALAAVTRPAPTASISASSTNIPYNGSVTINWSSTNADTLSSNFGDNRLSGTQTFFNQTSSRTFRITATNPTGSAQASVGVNVAAAPTPPPPPPPPPSPSIVITSQPSPVSATFNRCTGGGGSVNFSVAASVNDPTGQALQYQWYLNGSPLSNSGILVSGAQSSTLTLRVLESQSGNNTVYARVSYSGAPTAQSSSVSYSVTVTEPRPIITQTAGDPLDQTVIIGETATFDIRASASDGRSLNYQWTNNGRPFVDGTNNSSFPFGTISGATTRTLRYTPSSTSAGGIIYAIITDPNSNCTASNSPFQSEAAAFTVQNPSKIIKIASRDGNTSSMSYSNFDLFSGNYTSSGQIEFVSPFQDIQVDIKMLGGAGGNNGSYRGGQGGTSIIRLTLRRNVEYIIRTVVVGGGSNGGASCVLYDRARLIAVVGGGGGAGTDGNGGRGGGAGVAGENGQGVYAGRGGNRGPASLGYFPGGDPYCQTITSGSIFGGLISSCSIGGETCRSNPTDQYWIRNYSPCDLYAGLARDRNGNTISNSLNLERGFKEGIGHRQNGGIRATSTEGGGGNGSEGGWSGLPGTRSGGGGGGGYANGVSVVGGPGLGGNSGGASFTIGLVGRLF